MNDEKHVVSETDLDWLEKKGHQVNREPTVLLDGRKYYHIDGLPRTEEQIVLYITKGTPRGH